MKHNEKVLMSKPCKKDQTEKAMQKYNNSFAQTINP